MSNIYSINKQQQHLLTASTRENRGGAHSTSLSSFVSVLFHRRNIVQPRRQHPVRSFIIVTLIASLVGILIILSATVTDSSITSSSTQIVTTTAATMEQQISNDINHCPKPFSLLVKLTFTELQHQQEFLKDITPLCQYIKEYESTTTIAYEVLLSDQDPLQVFIIERYIDKENAFLQIHKTSPSFLEFRTKLQTMQNNQYVTIDGSSYYDRDRKAHV